jgi:hypothetical protein
MGNSLHLKLKVMIVSSFEYSTCRNNHGFGMRRLKVPPIESVYRARVLVSSVCFLLSLYQANPRSLYLILPCKLTVC